MIKQVSLALIALGLSMSAQAGYPSDEVMPVAPPTVNVTIPQQMGSWSVGLEALYEAANNGDFHYASSTHVVVAGGTTTNDRRVHGVDMDNDWGGHIDLAYNFAGDGRYVKLGYTHLTVSDSDRFTHVTGDTLVGVGIDGVTPVVVTPVEPTLAGVANWDSAQGKSKAKYNAVDLVFGQRFDFGQKVTLDAFGGLRYVNLEQRDSASYNFGTATTSDVATLRLKSDFNGIGPRAGFNGQVRLGSGFSIVGTMAGSLVVGDFDTAVHRRDDATTGIGTTPATVTTINNDTIGGESTRVVPELDARLGVNYTASFTPDTAVGIELGYEVVNYFDVNGNSQLSYADTANHTSDFAMQGPYLRLQVDIA